MPLIGLALLLGSSGCAVAQNPSSQSPECGIYTYRAEIVRVIDGDTVVADIDLGFETWRRNEHLRLFGIDAPERGTPEGKEVKAALTERIEGQSLLICTIKAKSSPKEATGSFGRYLVKIYQDGENINQWLLDTGRAVPFEK